MSEARNPLKALLGGLLMATGLLVAGLAGLCTLTMGVMTALQGLDAFISTGPALGLGAIPIGIGVAIFAAGRQVWRSTKKAD
ncbi:MAG: hypothetical protein JWM33_372 [Caulobacteraceae bacterium]|nr:hypothetical protein [Caulobacteraceae bacterium]